MKNNTRSKQELSEFSPLIEVLLKSSNDLANEEVVIYDECGDTLWDRVLAQEDKSVNPSQQQKPGEFTTDIIAQPKK